MRTNACASGVRARGPVRNARAGEPHVCGTVDPLGGTVDPRGGAADPLRGGAPTRRGADSNPRGGESHQRGGAPTRRGADPNSRGGESHQRGGARPIRGTMHTVGVQALHARNANSTRPEASERPCVNGQHHHVEPDTLGGLLETGGADSPSRGGTTSDSLHRHPPEGGSPGTREADGGASPRAEVSPVFRARRHAS